MNITAHKQRRGIMGRFGEDGHISAAEAGKKSKRGKSLKGHIKLHLDQAQRDNGKKISDDAMEEALTGDLRAREFLLRESGILRSPEEIEISDVTPTFLVRPPKDSPKDSEEDDEL